MVMANRWAFVGLTLLSAAALVRCGASTNRPNVEVSNDDDAGTTSTPDGGGVTHFDAADTYVPPADTGTPGLTVLNNTVDFGQVGCGSQAARKLVTLKNSGTAVLTVSGNFQNGSNAFDFDF